jgi:hypothetical protein
MKFKAILSKLGYNGNELFLNLQKYFPVKFPQKLKIFKKDCCF